MWVYKRCGGRPFFGEREAVGVPVFQPIRKKNLAIRAILCTFEAQKAQNRSNESFGSILCCFKPFLTTTGNIFRNFRDFLQILVNFYFIEDFLERVGGYHFFG
jgi:hypothetical protein